MYIHKWSVNHSLLTVAWMSVQDVSQAIADVEKMEREEQANRKALLEAKSQSDTKEADENQTATEHILEGMKMVMEVPVMVETSAPEPQAVAEVIEVPAQGPSASDLDIIIVDSSTLGGQEEVPPDTECQMVEVVLDGKNNDGNKEDVTNEATISTDPQETLRDSGEKDVSMSGEKVAVGDIPQDGPAEIKQDDPADSSGPDSAAVSENVIAEDVDKDHGMDEASRIEVVAIEIPTSKSEEKEFSEKDKNEELDKEKEQSIKKEEDEMMVEKDNGQETHAVDTAKHDEAAKSRDRKGSVDLVSTEGSEGQGLENMEVKKEGVKSDVEKEITEESLEDEVEENVERERATGSETADEQCEKEEEDLPTAEPKEGSVKQSKEGLNKETEKQDTEAEELVIKICEATEKMGEAVEEDDSRAESSEDEKKTDKKAWPADHGEEAILENARYSNFW
jgi:hypothetical protein